MSTYNGIARSSLPPTLLDQLRRDLEHLKLRAMVEHLDEALLQAQKTEPGYIAFLAGLVSRQVLAMSDRAAQGRLNRAKFPSLKTFEEFDLSFQPGLNAALVRDLMLLEWVRQGRSLLVLGRHGTGKTHLALAYGHLAALRGFSVRYYDAQKLLDQLYQALADASIERLLTRLSRLDLLIIDDLRDTRCRPEHASLLFDLIDARYQKRSTLLTSNLSVTAWGKALGNATLTAAMVDRLMERAAVLNIRRGRSYRTEGPHAVPVAEQPEDLVRDSQEPVSA